MVLMMFIVPHKGVATVTVQFETKMPRVSWHVACREHGPGKATTS